MAPILTRLVHTDNPFKKHRRMILDLFHFGKNSIKSDKLDCNWKGLKILKTIIFS